MSTARSTRPLPFDGIRVVSLAQLGQGPAAVQMLADYGADVIKVERPGTGAFERSWAGASAFREGESFFFLSLNRNQRSVTLDLKSDKGREIALRLLDEADIVVENYRPGVMERLGLGYDLLRERNPRLIYCSSSGYGPTGPYRGVPGQDLLMQAFSGLASVTGRASDPPTPTGSPIVDFHAAALLAFGISTALFMRERTGNGQKVESSLLEAAIHLQLEPLFYQVNGWDITERSDAGLGSNFHPGPYGIYRTVDGHVAISLSPPSLLGAALGIDELRDFDDSQSFEHREEIKRLIQERVANLPSDELLEILHGRDIWSAPVLDYRQLIDHPQVQASGIFETWEHPTHGSVTHIRQPLRLSDVPADQVPRDNPPALGAHTVELLQAIGYDNEQIAALREERVI